MAWRLEGRGPAISDRAEGSDLRADRWDRRRGHHFVAGRNRRSAQLGLSLLLVARRELYFVCDDAGRLPPGSAIMAGMVAARDRRQRRADADHVRSPRGAAAR